jgi:hypothetical protein
MTNMKAVIQVKPPLARRLQRKNPSRMTADGLLAQQFSLNKIPHRTGPVDPDSDYFSTGRQAIHDRQRPA